MGAKQVPSSMKATLIVHLIVGGVFGLFLLFIPQTWLTWNNLPAQDAEIWRLFGAVILGLAFSSMLACREAAWDRIKIVVWTEVFWTVLGTLVLVYGLIWAALPAIAWAFAAVLALFALAFIAFAPRR